MDKIARLRQEIERRRLHFNKEAEKYQALNNGYSQNCYGARDALRDLENFLDTLSEEPDKSLEAAAEKYRRESYSKSILPNIDGPTSEYGGSIKESFIAGAEWQKEQDDKETADLLTIAHLQGMEQMKRQLLQGSPMPEDTVLFNKGVQEGRRLEREDMMKDAVEGEVVVPIYEGDDTWSAEIKIPGSYEIGDKVRIVVLKEKE